MDERIPAELFHPRELIKEELEFRSITRPPASIQKVLDGADVTPRSAQALQALLAVDAQYWLNLQANYDRGE